MPVAQLGLSCAPPRAGTGTGTGTHPAAVSGKAGRRAGGQAGAPTKHVCLPFTLAGCYEAACKEARSAAPGLYVKRRAGAGGRRR